MPDSTAPPDPQILQQADILQRLDARQLETLAAHTRRRRLQRGEFLFRAGQPAGHFFLLRSGRIKLFVDSARGEEKILNLVEPGETFAEGAAFMEAAPRYPAHAQALVQSEVWAMETAVLRDLLLASPATGLRLLARQTRRIQQLLAEVEALALESAHARLIAYLLNRADTADEITLAGPQTLLAAQLAMKPETLSRLLGELQRRGLISVGDGRIRLRDRPGLQAAALEPALRR